MSMMREEGRGREKEWEEFMMRERGREGEWEGYIMMRERKEERVGRVCDVIYPMCVVLYHQEDDLRLPRRPLPRQTEQ